jgi:mRNA interferase RelE/StbE
MKYQILIRRSAQKSLSALPSKDYIRVKQAIYDLSDDPRPMGHKKLTNRPGYRIRVGNYRIIYEIYDNKLEVIILLIGHRRDIYD